MMSTPAVSHRFLVNFLFNNIPNPFDIAFQRISGLSRTLEVSQHREGARMSATSGWPSR
nr:Afp5 [Serratia proteamaculans]